MLKQNASHAGNNTIDVKVYTLLLLLLIQYNYTVAAKYVICVNAFISKSNTNYDRILPKKI